jgi:histone deacetylase complex regulatory component SIN3
MTGLHHLEEPPTLHDALKYLDYIKLQAPIHYDSFLDIMKEWKSDGEMNVWQVTDKVELLFRDREEVLKGFIISCQQVSNILL